jgi:hypothetical protein
MKMAHCWLQFSEADALLSPRLVYFLHPAQANQPIVGTELLLFREAQRAAALVVERRHAVHACIISIRVNSRDE